ncbi:helix-turn-helix domain-containing protein [Leucobacter komagatae]
MVADNLAAELARRRISGRQASAAMGLSVPYVARRISGETPLDVNDLFAFSALLGVSPAVLLGTENPHQSPDGGVSVGPAGIEPTTSTV